MSPDSVRRGMHRLGIAIGALICLPLAIVALLAASEGAALALIIVAIAVALTGAFYGATRLVGWIIVGFMRDDPSTSRLDSHVTSHSMKIIGVGIIAFGIAGIVVAVVIKLIVKIGVMISGYSETKVGWALVIAVAAWFAYHLLREWAEERARKRESARRHGGQ